MKKCFPGSLGDTGRARLYLKARRFIIYIVMFFLFLLALVPIYIMLVNSTRSTVQINNGLSLIPGGNIVHNWKALTSQQGFDITKGFLNSAFIAVFATLCTVYFSSMTAYGLHVYRFKGRLFLWGLILLVMMLPASLSFIGFYKFMARLQLLDNYIPLILPAIASGATVLFLRQYMSAVLSLELIDAARIDGAGEYGIFNRIILPVLAPALATQAIFAFVGSWNNFFAPFIFISSAGKYTLPMLVQSLRAGYYRTEYGGIYLGLTISIVPILIFYSLMSRFIISGLTLGSIKE
ncbi:MAG: carbohydrate ABC transporter permease [Treponema sp.]|jgi:multiple sugar transport system permease protein|nr:carbohydrate ABC transporter permease [Treponema sp.]